MPSTAEHANTGDGARVADSGLFVAGAALVFTAGTAITIHGCMSMAAMSAMPMPGGWTMSMAWMRMPGQGWAGAAASFIGMWSAMMVAMMLPVLAPPLWRYRQALGTARRGRLVALAGLGYFCVWTALGASIYPIGSGLAALAMWQPAIARAVPFATGMVVLGAGVLQFTAWKMRGLACCRMAPPPALASAGAAWRHGVRLGVQCCRCCAGPTAVLLVVGVMDWRAMLFVTAAIAAERLAPAGESVAKVVGVAGVVLGLLLLHAAVVGCC